MVYYDRTIMKSMAECLNTDKKITNHSMRKTLVAKLKKAGQSLNVICEITGHARESSLDNYDKVDENQRKELPHIISGFKNAQKTSKVLLVLAQLLCQSIASPFKFTMF